jgi:hypothetical protein
MSEYRNNLNIAVQEILGLPQGSKVNVTRWLENGKMELEVSVFIDDTDWDKIKECLV